MEQTSQQGFRRSAVWEWPWGFAESLLVTGGLLLVGVALELAAGPPPLELLRWPVNLAVLGAAALLLVLVFLAFPRAGPVRWLSGPHAAVGSLSGLVVVTLIAGLVPQGRPPVADIWTRLGFSHAVRSWPFVLANAFLLSALGLAILRRARAPRRGRAGFFLNHAGLWLALSAALAGAGDLERVRMKLFLGQAAWSGTDAGGEKRDMDFALTLRDFDMEQFPPELGLVDNVSGKFHGKPGRDTVAARPGNTRTIRGWEIRVEKVLESSGRAGGDYHPVRDVGAVPAARVVARKAGADKERAGWVTCGSFRMPFEALRLDPGSSVVMLDPVPRKFLSRARLESRSGRNEEVEILVNRPVQVDGWKLYQVGYDERMGKWSHYSVIEAVRDPWLPAVYCGIFMMLAGAAALFVVGAGVAGEARP
jgi:hypothetical protein